VQVDGVMGGRSSGRLRFEGGAMEFTGTINLQGGGFSSVRRSMPTVDLSKFAGVLVGVETDAFPQKKAPLGLHLQLQDASSWWGYASAFAVPLSETAGELATAFLPLSSFDRASASGRRCSTCRLDPTRVNGIDLYVLFQEGPFRVRVRSITAVEASWTSPVPVVPLPSAAAVEELFTAAINSGTKLDGYGYTELCAAIYASSLRTLLAATGPSNGAKGVACAGLEHAAGQRSKSDRAWGLRDTMDAILADLKGTARGSRQDWLPGADAAQDALEACKLGENGSMVDFSEPGELPSPSPSGEGGGSGSLEAFEGPFSRMGISGFNDLGSSLVASPGECAARCLRNARCRSFDYGARQNVAGECWLSTANRESVGPAYTVWELYDYYERRDISDPSDPSDPSGDPSDASYAGDAHPATLVAPLAVLVGRLAALDRWLH